MPCFISASRAADNSRKARASPPASGCAVFAVECPMNFWRAEAAVERQPEQLPVMFLRRERCRRSVALAEARQGQSMQRLADHPEPPPRGLPRRIVGAPQRGVAQGRQALRRGVTQRVVLGGACDVEREARGLMPVDRSRRPQAVDPELPVLQLRVHGAILSAHA